MFRENPKKIPRNVQLQPEAAAYFRSESQMNMVEEARQLLSEMNAARATATVRYLRANIDTMTTEHAKLVLEAASGPLRSGSASHVFVDHDKLCMDTDLFGETDETLALMAGNSIRRYQCVRLKRPSTNLSDEPDLKRAKRNHRNVTFDMEKVDFAVIQHMPNYFEVVTRLDPVLQDMIARTPEHELHAEVSHDVDIGSVNDTSYDSVVVPLVVRKDRELIVKSGVLLVVKEMSIVSSPSTAGVMNSLPFACLAI